MKVQNKSDLTISVIFFFVAVLSGVLVVLDIVAWERRHLQIYIPVMVVTSCISGYKSRHAFFADD